MYLRMSSMLYIRLSLWLYRHTWQGYTLLRKSEYQPKHIQEMELGTCLDEPRSQGNKHTIIIFVIMWWRYMKLRRARSSLQSDPAVEPLGHYQDCQWYSCRSQMKGRHWAEPWGAQSRRQQVPTWIRASARPLRPPQEPWAAEAGCSFVTTGAFKFRIFVRSVLVTHSNRPIPRLARM